VYRVYRVYRQKRTFPEFRPDLHYAYHLIDRQSHQDTKYLSTKKM
jgi:hypothetical protein